jgi:hypothetical protein
MATPACRECGVTGAKPAQKLNPRTYAVERALLCARCRELLGWQPATYPKTGAWR